MIMKRKGGLHIKFGKTIHRKNGLTHPQKDLKRFKDSGTMNRKEGSGKPRSVTTEENTDLIEELICSQEEAPHTYLIKYLTHTPRKIVEQTGINRSSIRRMIKRRNFRQLKRVKTAEMNDGYRNRRYARAIALAEKFE